MFEPVALDSQPCAICHKPSRTRVHPGCQAHIAENIDALPSLYAALAEYLAPGRRGGDGRSGTRTAPLPCSLEVLDLRGRGGIEGILTSWEASTRELLGWAPAEPRNVGQAVECAAEFLRLNLTWICDNHPAIDDMAREASALRRQCERQITGEKPERRIAVACHCGGTLHVTLSTPGTRCVGCGQQYGHAEALQLPLARRAVA